MIVCPGRPPRVRAFRRKARRRGSGRGTGGSRSSGVWGEMVTSGGIVVVVVKVVVGGWGRVVVVVIVVVVVLAPAQLTAGSSGAGSLWSTHPSSSRSIPMRRPEPGGTQVYV